MGRGGEERGGGEGIPEDRKLLMTIFRACSGGKASVWN